LQAFGLSVGSCGLANVLTNSIGYPVLKSISKIKIPLIYFCRFGRGRLAHNDGNKM